MPSRQTQKPWVNIPIQIGRPGYYDNPNDPIQYQDPLVDTNITVGPYQGYTPSDLVGGIRSIYQSIVSPSLPAVTAAPSSFVMDPRLDIPVAPNTVPYQPQWNLNPDPVAAAGQSAYPALDVVTPIEDRASREKGSRKALIDIDPNIYSTGQPNVVDPSKIKRTTINPSDIPAPPPEPNDPNALTLGNVWRDLTGNAFNRVYPNSAGVLAGQPMPESVWRSGTPESGPVRNIFDTVTGQFPDLSQTPYELTEQGRPYSFNPNPLQAAVDAAPYGRPQADIPPPPQPAAPDYPDVGGFRADPGRWSGNKPPAPEPAAPETPAKPAAPEDPASTIPPPPGMATGALTFGDMLKQMKEYYPDQNWNDNPAQALADANAKRDLERTSLLAQLSFASGIVSGAGESWKGLGAGFASAAGTYDKGFEKYQNALQSAADRYAHRQEQMMNYDNERRRAALTLYTNNQSLQTEYWKTLNERKWELEKFNKEGERSVAKANLETLDKQYQALLDQYKPPSDPTLDSDELRAMREAHIKSITQAWNRARELGYFIHPDNMADATVANK